MRALALFGLFLAASAAQEPPATSPAATSPAETKPYRIGGGVTAPSVIYKVEPEYSEEARQARFEGTVIVYVVVDETGNPRGLKVIRPLGLGLDEKAIEAVQQWKFKPGMKAGRPVAVQATIEVNFRLYRGWRIVSISFETPDGVSRPVLTRQKLPPVPTGGRASVTLSFDVDERGNPTHFRVKESSDEKLEGELLAAVRDWVFTPGAKNGKAVLVPCVAKFVLDETVSPAGPRAAAEAAPSKTVDPAKMAAIEEMFAVTKVDQMIRQVLSRLKRRWRDKSTSP
jgi:TonB family protein